MGMHRAIFSLLIILLPVQLGYHLWPSWALVLGRRVDFLSPTLHLTDILILLLIIFWLRTMSIKGLYALLRRMVYGVFLFVGFVSMNIVFAENQMVAAYHWLKFAEFFLLGAYIVKTKVTVEYMSKPLSAAVFVSSVVALGQFIFQRSIGGPLWVLGERTFAIDTPGIARTSVFGRELLRAYSTFPHPNVLGGFLTVAVPLILSAKLVDKARAVSRYRLMLISVSAIALLTTFSRSAFVLSLLGLSWWLWKKARIFFFIPLLVLFFVPFSLTDESYVIRSQLNTSALTMITSAPLFGVGLGNFLIALPDLLPSRTIYFLQPVHNIYLLLLSEIGLVGAAGVLYLLWRIRKHMNPSVSLVVVLLLGFVDHYFLTLQQGRILFTIVIALCLVTKGASRHASRA